MSRIALAFALALGLAPASWGQQPGLPADSSALAARAEQLFVRGLTRAYLGDHAGAAALYEQVLALRPQEAAVLGALAESHEARGEFAAARYYAERAVAAAPREA
jgi:Tfp pilus assembly protein PilF